MAKGRPLGGVALQGVSRLGRHVGRRGGRAAGQRARPVPGLAAGLTRGFGRFLAE
jgi:hypothetical protein